MPCEAGAAALAAFTATLSKNEWQMRLPRDTRKIGVVVHHVASVYPIEIQRARLLADGKPIMGVTWDGIVAMNREHSQENDGVVKDSALALLEANSAAAAAAICAFSDEDLDRRRATESWMREPPAEFAGLRAQAPAESRSVQIGERSCPWEW